MAVNQRLQELLDRNHVVYSLFPHREVFTAHEVAQVSHVPPRSVAKVVVVRDAGGADVLVVLPAGEHFDPGELHRVTGRTGFQLENERELARLFPDCEVGAMPPFGALYGLTTYVDPCLLENSILYVQPGNHHELMRLRREDFERMAEPFHAGHCLHKVKEPLGG
jgi:Ala-tRNA(Pro) deacylase